MFTLIYKTMKEILIKKIGKLQDENIAKTTQLMNSTNDYTAIILDNEIRVNVVLIKKLLNMKKDLKTLN